MQTFRTIPILRIFDVPKAMEFYRDYLGCTVNWEHRFEPDMPLYAEVARGDLVLHLSEHYGDATPGSTVFVVTTGLEALHSELRATNYHYLRPGLDDAPWGGKVMELIDPFGNRLRFSEMDNK